MTDQTPGESSTDPRAAREALKVGDAVEVPREWMTRGGEYGTVVDVFDHGVSLDFFRCFCGATRCACYTSIEFWSFEELGL
jgi:hypothetical protein